MFSTITSYLTGGKKQAEKPRYRQQRQLDTYDQVSETLNNLVTQQLKDEFELEQVKGKIDANKAQWLQQGASGRAMLSFNIQKRKELERAIQTKEGQIRNLEKVQRTGQDAAVAVSVAETMKDANTMVQDLTSQVDVEDVEDIYDEFADHVEEVDEIGRATSQPVLGTYNYEVESDIAAEIAAMEASLAAETELKLPEAPREKPKVVGQQGVRKRYTKPQQQEKEEEGEEEVNV